MAVIQDLLGLQLERVGLGARSRLVQLSVLHLALKDSLDR